MERRLVGIVILGLAVMSVAPRLVVAESPVDCGVRIAGALTR